MKNEIEVEDKFELDEGDFRKLLSGNRVERCVEQVNIYFDYDWVLARSKSTFRIRLTSGQEPLLTFKFAAVFGTGGTRTVREMELPLRHVFAGGLLAICCRREVDVRADLPLEMRQALEGMGVTRLQRVGWVRNKRYVVDLHGDGLVEFDWLRLPDGRSVYEAEIENSDSDVRAYLVARIRETAPAARVSGISKFERFWQAASAQCKPANMSRAAIGSAVR